MALVTVITTIIEGGGTLPKNIDAGSYVRLDASVNNEDTYVWELLSKPQESATLVETPIASATKVGPLSQGSYQVRLTINASTPRPQIKMVSFSVPGVVSAESLADDPPFGGGGDRVNNYNFEMPGPLPGWALNWTIADTLGISQNRMGATRGRIVPTNFSPTGGLYAMALGDDIGANVPAVVGEVFEAYQEVDFTNVKELRVRIGYILR